MIHALPAPTLQCNPTHQEHFMKTIISLCLITAASVVSAQGYSQSADFSSGLSKALTTSIHSLGVRTGSNPSSTYVRPYLTQEGTVVQGYHRTAPDNSILNNFSTVGNVNPYTGAVGTRKACTAPGC
jgi:hypothetical protein